MFLPCLSRLLTVPSSVPFSVSPMPKICLSLRKNTERILMKFAAGDDYHKQIKLLHVGRNRNRKKVAGYDRVFESTSVAFAAMSNRC